MRRIRRAAATVVVVSAIALGASACSKGSDDVPRVGDITDPRTPVEHEYVIPEGTAARIAAGEEVAIVPQELTVHVGEAIRIVNEDVRPHTVGPYFVGIGETVTQRFVREGELIGECTVHPSERFVLKVLP